MSIKTVSNVVNNYPHVTPQMRAKVQRAIDELGYRPNLTARHLRKGRTGIIAFAVPELGNPYFAELAGAVIDAAAQHDYTVLVDHTAGLRERELLVCQEFRSHVIDGLILSPIHLENDDLLARQETSPLVLLGEREYEAPYDQIAIDNVAAARSAVRHLSTSAGAGSPSSAPAPAANASPPTCACAAGARNSPPRASHPTRTWSSPPTATAAATGPPPWRSSSDGAPGPTPSSRTTT